jgi:hypothetical protein
MMVSVVWMVSKPARTLRRRRGECEGYDSILGNPRRVQAVHPTGNAHERIVMRRSFIFAGFG